MRATLFSTGYNYIFSYKSYIHFLNPLNLVMTSMECSPTAAEPPKKTAKLELPLNLRQKHEKPITSSPKPNIVQRIKYVLAEQHSRQHARTLHAYYEVTENLTVFNLENGEMLVVNAPLNEICNWPPAPIPYLCLSVESNVFQRTAINRTAIMLSSLYQLTNCAVGIKIDMEKCQETGSQLQDLTALRRAIWQFLVNDITFMPPHLRQFFNAELKVSSATIQQQKLPQPESTNDFKSPGNHTNKVTQYCT